MKTFTYKNNWMKSLMSYKVQWMLGLAFIISCGFACEEDLPGEGEIEDTTPPEAIFVAEVDVDDYLIINFINASVSATDYVWDFGDNEISEDENPSHKFATVGEYVVTLVSTDKNNAVSTFIDTLLVAKPPVASFTFEKDFTKVNTYDFQNTSEDAVSIEWDFGNGVTSTEDNPSVTYTGNGQFNVTLTVINEIGIEDVAEELIVVGASTPVIFNPDFEIFDYPTETSTSTCPCYGWVNNTVGKLPNSTGDAYEGEGAIKLPADDPRVAYQEVDIDAGYDYSFEFYYSGNIFEGAALRIRILNGPLNDDVSTITEDMVIADFSFEGSGATKTYIPESFPFNSGSSSKIAIVMTAAGQDYRVDNTAISVVYD